MGFSELDDKAALEALRIAGARSSKAGSEFGNDFLGPDFLRYLCGKAVDWMEKVSEEQYRAR